MTAGDPVVCPHCERVCRMTNQGRVQPHMHPDAPPGTAFVPCPGSNQKVGSGAPR